MLLGINYIVGGLVAIALSLALSPLAATVGVIAGGIIIIIMDILLNES